MDDQEFTAGLRGWLKQPTAVRQTINRLIRNPPASDARPTLKEAYATCLAALVALVDIDFAAKQYLAWVVPAVASGDISAESARRMSWKLLGLYVATEKAFGPLIDRLLRYEVAKANAQLAAVEVVDEIEDKLFAIQLARAERGVIA